MSPQLQPGEWHNKTADIAAFRTHHGSATRVP